ncbi:MAG: hypothetical protein GWO24_22430 [Akkermansiaceae bacterium]|nr:hypothetical protein [Akkermansiaceae bacterium]
METVGEQREALHRELERDLGKGLFAKLELDRGGFGRRGDRRGPGGPGRGFRGPGRGGPVTPLRPQGRSAFVHTDPATGTTSLFDFVNIAPRKSGYKVRLHKDRMLDGMRTINVLYEPDERTCINEPLAYDLYRAAGNATPRAGYLRVVIDGNLVGYHFWFEQVNGSFLRHNEIGDKGNLYKVTWQGSSGASEFTPEDLRPDRRSDVVRRYEKKSNLHEGYEDLIELVEALEGAEGNDRKMWELIEERFDVENVINYFAANSLLSHWDGFFNNYYLYHDTKRDKWMMFPYDQDSTWSQRPSDESLIRMPLNFGAADAVRPGGGRGFGFGFGRGPEPGSRDRDRGRPGGREDSRDDRPAPGANRDRGFGGRGFGWWRDGGEISKPLLANPEFRKRFLARLQELTGTVFTEGDFGTRIANAEELLKTEVILRARDRKLEEQNAVGELRDIMQSMRSHLVARREFIISELKNLAAAQPTAGGD